jgi:hypothetical protein
MTACRFGARLCCHHFKKGMVSCSRFRAGKNHALDVPSQQPRYLITRASRRVSSPVGGPVLLHYPATAKQRDRPEPSAKQRTRKRHDT